jgi:2-iminobutanoate/2-iminopropanoate deaminase
MTVKLFTPPTLPTRGGYSQVCEVTRGRLILIAGQVPHDAHDKMVGEGDFDAQVEQVFKNVGRALEAAGGSFDNLVKINNYCVETVSYEQRANYRTIRDRFVNTAAPPVSTFIYVPRLAQPNWLFEMDAMAVIDG